jgi:hypothetical protein
MRLSDAARQRFSEETRLGKPVSKADLLADKTLLERYEAGWFGRRRRFLVAVRDFNANFLALPALPSQHGPGGQAANAHSPPRARHDDRCRDQFVAGGTDQTVEVDLGPCQLRAIHVGT